MTVTCINHTLHPLEPSSETVSKDGVSSAWSSRAAFRPGNYPFLMDRAKDVLHDWKRSGWRMSCMSVLGCGVAIIVFNDYAT